MWKLPIAGRAYLIIIKTDKNNKLEGPNQNTHVEVTNCSAYTSKFPQQITNGSCSLHCARRTLDTFSSNEFPGLWNCNHVVYLCLYTYTHISL